MCPIHVYIIWNTGDLKTFSSIIQTINLVLAKSVSNMYFCSYCFGKWSQINPYFEQIPSPKISFELKKKISGANYFNKILQKFRIYGSTTVKKLFKYYKRGLEVLGSNFKDKTQNKYFPHYNETEN